MFKNYFIKNFMEKKIWLIIILLNIIFNFTTQYKFQLFLLSKEEEFSDHKEDLQENFKGLTKKETIDLEKVRINFNTYVWRNM